MLKADQEGQKIVKKQNVELWTQSFGKSSSPCILLIMGAGCQGLMWHDSFCRDLADKGYFIIRYDNRDIGQSTSFDFTSNPYNLETLAQDALAILDDYEIKKTHLVGSSMGGMIALRVALNHPERVLSLTLLSSGDHKVFTDALAGRDLSQHELPPPSQDFIDLVRHYRPATSEEEFLNFGVEFLRIVNGRAAFDSEKARNLQRKLLAHTSAKANPLNHFYACDSSESCLQRLKELKIPTLIIHGEKDTLLPLPHAQKLKELISHAKLVIIPEMGHFFSENFSEEITNLIYRHILPIQPALTFEKEHQKWHQEFEKLKKELKKAFWPLEIDLYHIGSTYIPNAYAKPIIDILGVVQDIRAVDAYQSKLKELRFTSLGEYGMRGRRFFKKEGVHLHIFEDTSVESMRHLSFRNFLTAHPEYVVEYNELKQKLAVDFQYDIKNYVLGKSDFIKKIDMMATIEGKTPFLTKKVLRKNKWTQSELIEANELNMLSHMSFFCHFVPKLNTTFHPEVSIANSVIEDQLFNYALFAKFNSQEVGDKIDEVRALFKYKPFTWWVGEKDTPDLGRHLEEKGFVAVGKHLAMFYDLNKFKGQTKNTLKIQRVENQENLEAFGSCVTTLGFPQIAFEEIFLKGQSLLFLEGVPFELYVGKFEGKTVVTGALFFQANAAGIYYISTLPAYQRKGFATMMLEFLLQRAKDQGYFLSILQTSSENKGIYSSLGFKDLTQITEYA